jgi:hypothetical protein
MTAKTLRGVTFTIFFIFGPFFLFCSALACVIVLGDALLTLSSGTENSEFTESVLERIKIRIDNRRYIQGQQLREE